MGVPREDPEVAFEVFRRVLKLAINRLVRLFDDFHALRFRMGIVLFDIRDEDRETLRPCAKLRRT